MSENDYNPVNVRINYPDQVRLVRLTDGCVWKPVKIFGGVDAWEAVDGDSPLILDALQVDQQEEKGCPQDECWANLDGVTARLEAVEQGLDEKKCRQKLESRVKDLEIWLQIIKDDRSIFKPLQRINGFEKRLNEIESRLRVYRRFWWTGWVTGILGAIVGGCGYALCS